MSSTKHQPLNLLHPPQLYLLPAVSNSSSEEDYDGPSEDRIDRSFKARKIVYKYPVRYAKKKVRPIVKHPTLHPKFYTSYSHWTKCDVFCRQRRERFCTVRSKCGYHIHVEERNCHRKLWVVYCSDKVVHRVWFSFAMFSVKFPFLEHLYGWFSFLVLKWNHYLFNLEACRNPNFHRFWVAIFIKEVQNIDFSPSWSIHS